MSRSKSTAVAFASVLLAAGCSAAPDELVDDPLVSTEEPIIAGTAVTINGNAVALYGKTQAGTCGDYSYGEIWWPRPCSGTVIRKDGNVNYILTARHCVTRDGEIGGPLITNPAHLRATSVVNPGVIPTLEQNYTLVPQGSPPAYTVTATVHYTDTFWGDLAIVKATGNLTPTTSPQRHAILAFSGTFRDEYVGTNLSVMGYGRTDGGNCSGHNSSGAGVLRKASGLNVEDVAYDTIRHYWESPGGTGLAHGDSGGPLYTVESVPFGYTTTELAGVNREIVWDPNSGVYYLGAGSEALIHFLQSSLPLYLINVENAAGSLVVGTEGQVGSILQFGFAEDTFKTRMRFVQYSDRLTFNGLCVNDEGNNQPVKLRTCGGTQHKWRRHPNGVMVNGLTGRCLHRPLNSSTLVATACSSSTRRWSFVVDNHLI